MVTALSFFFLIMESANMKLFKLTILVPVFLITGVLKAQNETDVIRNTWLHYSDASNSLYHHLTEQAFELLAKRKSETYDLMSKSTTGSPVANSLSGWQQRQEIIKKTLLDIVGPFPEKTPLNAKIVRTIDKEGFRIEHIIYESQPGFFVTSSMFIPDGLKGKTRAPAIIYVSGHSAEGYRSAVYLNIITNLVMKGFVVFAFDPVGQGERYEYIDPSTGKSLISGANEHTYSGIQAFITGSSQARYMIWDGIRAVDYLLTRKEVDPGRIGITGRSGGGTQSAYISAMDDRIYAAAPENYLTNFTRLLMNIGPQDAEQNMFNIISRGLDHPDYLIVRAPKPALMITTSRDMFNIQGVLEMEKEVAAIYRAYEKEENFSRIEDDAPHASTEKNRKAMYAFFQQHLNKQGSNDDIVTTPYAAEEVKVTSTGQVLTSLKGETVNSLNRKEAEKRISELEISRRNIDSHLNSSVNSAMKLSGYKEPDQINEPVLTGRFQREGYVVEKYFVRGEGNYVIPYLIMKPETSNKKALVYLHPSGKNTEAAVGGEIEWFVRKGFTVLAPDLIGTGETGPEKTVFNHAHIQKWFASMLIGRSIVGVRAGDLVMLVNLLKKDTGMEIYGLARREMGPVMLHAAAFSPAISSVALIEPFCSYKSIVMNKFYDFSFIYGTVPAALKAYDLPDLAASLAPRKLLMANVTDGNGSSENKEAIFDDLKFVRTSYQYKNAGGALTVSYSENLNDLYLEWIK